MSVIIVTDYKGRVLGRKVVTDKEALDLSAVEAFAVLACRNHGVSRNAAIARISPG